MNYEIKNDDLSFASKRKDKGKVYKFWLSIKVHPNIIFTNFEIYLKTCIIF